MAAATAQTFASHGALDLVLPQNAKGIGTVILKPDAPELIDDVAVEPFPLWPDDRGYFLEIARMGNGLVGEFPASATQVSAALSYPGTIKAFHFHLHQTDYWVAAQGMFQVALVDLRRGSRTFGHRNTLYTGALRPWRIRIPPGVGHGYKVVGPDSAMLIYITNRTYNLADEGRIPYDDPGIHYDWELQHK
ncbi:MAG TPA: dTDP-4-dehydrorhamnose 3,5-epimerase family protein [Bryobacteraceae bacterium]|nr:dTDP-4-dehydrorhamnose 3,5-epimerase family protein [Bryobacteraceae bacterium]